MEIIKEYQDAINENDLFVIDIAEWINRYGMAVDWWSKIGKDYILNVSSDWVDNNEKEHYSFSIEYKELQGYNNAQFTMIDAAFVNNCLKNSGIEYHNNYLARGIINRICKLNLCQFDGKNLINRRKISLIENSDLPSSEHVFQHAQRFLKCMMQLEAFALSYQTIKLMIED